MKSYTDLGQSKILSKILSPKTADLWWAERFEGHVELNGDYIVSDTPYYYLSFTKPSDNNYSQDTIHDIPCWSLAALFNVLPNGTDVVKEEADTENEKYMCTVLVKDSLVTTFANNPIDACVEMIIKLNGLKKIIIMKKKIQKPFDIEAAKSALAMARISQIMANDERFGGIVTDEEWCDGNWLYVIIRTDNDLEIALRHSYAFLAFHSKEQAEQFLKENEDLVKDYYMMY